MEQAPLPAMEELAQFDGSAGMKRNAIRNWVPKCYEGTGLSCSWVAGEQMTGLHYSMSYFFEALGAK